MPQGKIYRTVIRFEILSDSPIPPMSLTDIAYNTDLGDMSGSFLDNEVENEELVGVEAVKAIQEQGSDPDFFNLDENGDEIE